MRRNIFAGAALVLIGLLIMAGTHQPGNIGDVALVQGVKPFARSIELPSMLPGYVLRHYCLHMPYDVAVSRLEKELAPQGWSHVDTYYKSEFHSKSLSTDFIRVTRGRLVTGLREPAGHKWFFTGSVNELSRKMGAMPDSRGWVTIITSRRLSRVDTLLMKTRKLVRDRPSLFASYEIVTPLPTKGGIGDVVSASAGTSRLEGTTGVAVNFTGAANQK